MEKSEKARMPQESTRIVTHEMAREAAHKMSQALYHGKPAPSLHFPEHPDDVDMILADYIKQQWEKERPATDAGTREIECPTCGGHGIDPESAGNHCDECFGRGTVTATDAGTEPTKEILDSDFKRLKRSPYPTAECILPYQMEHIKSCPFCQLAAHSSVSKVEDAGTEPTREHTISRLLLEHDLRNVVYPHGLGGVLTSNDGAKKALEAAYDAGLAARSSIESEWIAGWRPIETAPRDGTEILVDFGRCGIHSVAWCEAASGITIWCVDDRKFGPYALRGYVETDVKGWMPLPAPPAESAKDGTQ